MRAHEGERLIAALTNTIKGMIEGPAAGNGTAQGPPKPTPRGIGSAIAGLDEFEELYQKIKRRLLDELRIDPVFLKLLANVPELEVTIEPQVVELDASTLKGRVALLISRGYFDVAKKTGTVRNELARTGADPGGGGNLSDRLSELVRDGFLTREGDGYAKAPGIKLSERVLERR